MLIVPVNDLSLSAFISRGSTVHLSSCYTKGNFTIPPGTTIADVNIYSSDSPSELLHIRNDTCQLLGTVCIHISPERANRSPKFAISIYYGRVELEIVVTDEVGKMWRTILGHGTSPSS